MKMSSNLEDIFSRKESKKPNMYTMIWVKSGMIDLSIDGVLVPINVNQMTFITPSNYIQLIEGDGDVQILQFKRELYFIRDNDHEVSCNGILYFGS
jgi:AraC family transcriptional activator of pobA